MGISSVKHRLYFHLLFISSILTATPLLGTDSYSEALLAFKSEIKDDSNALHDWFIDSRQNPLGKTLSCCSWSGVKCNHNSTIVIALNLSARKLRGVLSGNTFEVFTDLVDFNISHNSFSGDLPLQIFNLTSLRSLDISKNNFSGQFPTEVSGLRNLVVLNALSNSFSGSLPVGISQLEYLKVLNLAGSYFSGSIPHQYGSFKSLEYLHLAGNSLSGVLPPELGKLNTVTHMEIGYNLYEGGIPIEFGNMSELQYLDISESNLSGSIPYQLSNLTKLESLFLFGNHLTGFIPLEFGRIISLVSLDLSDNKISGSIPKSFSELKNLRLLSLMLNGMSGSVPEEIAQLPSLDTLFIWNNFFSGSLPHNLGKHSKLRWLDVSTNNFSGNIPQEICAGGVLFKLMLFSNNFSGTLSPSLSSCSSLVRIRLEDNSFVGEIPSELAQFPGITYIDLSRNKFTGGIPADISKATKLQYFNVSNNPSLSGTMPLHIWSLPLLKNLSAFSCNISGDLPSFESCKSLSTVELHNNNLSGTFLRSVSNCHALKIMNLAGNGLAGSIPNEIGALPALSVLDLSRNKLSGTIPATFGKSSSLVFFNVSFNDISGSIPSGEIFRLMGSDAYIGNPKLCGDPLKQCKMGKKPEVILMLGFIIAVLFLATVAVLLYIRQRRKNQWKMVSFNGLPQFTAKDILKSFGSTESMETVPQQSTSDCKTVLPTGIKVLVKKIEWESKRIEDVSKVITQMGNARHKNLVRLLGFCYNKQLAYLLYDYLPNLNLRETVNAKQEMAAKYRIVFEIAEGLHFLHNECYPAMPHGDLTSSNIVVDNDTEVRLLEFGFKHLIRLSKDPILATVSRSETGEISKGIKDELCMDIYKFGEVIIEVLTNGRLMNAGGIIHKTPTHTLLREIYKDNNVLSDTSLQEEIKVVLDIALLCTRSRPSDRPSMEDVVKLLSVPKKI